MTPILYVKPLQVFVRRISEGSGRIMRMTARYQNIFSHISDILPVAHRLKRQNMIWRMISVYRSPNFKSYSAKAFHYYINFYTFITHLNVRQHISLINEWVNTAWSNSKGTDQVGEVNIQSFTVAKVRVHPTAMQDHLRHAFFDHLVVLRPEGSGNIKQNN